MGLDSVQIQVEPGAIEQSMDPSKIFLYFGYMMAAIFEVLGILVLFFLPANLHISDKFRVMFGIILLLYGFYRFFSLRIKQRQIENEERQFR